MKDHANKAAEKVRIAAEKQAMKDKVKADKAAAKSTKIKEPDAEHVPDSNDDEVEVASPKPVKPVKIFGAVDNHLDVKTKDCLTSIIWSADICLNTNTEANIQDQICSIIRSGLTAYAIHVGQPFDTEIG